MNTTVETSTAYTAIKQSLNDAVQLLKDNKGAFAWDDADCELRKEVIEKTGEFSQVKHLSATEKMKFTIESFMELGKLIAELQSSYQQVLLVQANFLNDTLDDTARSLTKELHMRGRLPRLAQIIAKELEKALSA